MANFAIIDANTNLVVNVIVAETFEIADASTPNHFRTVEIERPDIAHIGLMHDQEINKFMVP